MDEQNGSLNTNAPPAAETLREVVLRYEAPRPREVVSRYVQPMPLPGRRGTPATVKPERPPPAPARPRPRGRRGLRIALICLAVVFAAAAALGFAYRRGLLRNGFVREFRYEYELRRSYNDSGGETAIARYPNGGAAKLRYAEAHGSVLRIQEVYERVNPCTVTVATSLSDGSAIIGTGVIFTEDGYILTNAHVIAGGLECFVVRDTGQSYEAKLVGFDEEKDLAVVKVEARGLPTAEFGDSDALTVGDTVYAIGNPLGVELRGTLTDGIVSAINRDVRVDGVMMTLIQTNAALNNGNSGGPLINIYGQVVGINMMKMGSNSTVSVEGLGFAIPISAAAYMVNDLIAYGEVRGEPVIGISVRQEAVTLDTGESALEIMEVVSGGAGEKAGLALGDYVLRADDEAMTSSDDLLRVRRRYGAGETLTLEIDREGERFSVDVTLTEAER